MIQLWVESARLSIFKGKYNNLIDQSSGYSSDSSDQSWTSWSTACFIDQYLCSTTCYPLNICSTIEEFNIQRSTE